LGISEDVQAGVQVGPDFVEVGAERDFDESLDQSFLEIEQGKIGKAIVTLTEDLSTGTIALTKLKSPTVCVLRNKEFARAKNKFSKFDPDGDDTATFEELLAVLAADKAAEAATMPQSPSALAIEAKRMIDMMDADGNDEIDLAEYLFSNTKCSKFKKKFSKTGAIVALTENVMLPSGKRNGATVTLTEKNVLSIFPLKSAAHCTLTNDERDMYKVSFDDIEKNGNRGTCHFFKPLVSKLLKSPKWFQHLNGGFNISLQRY
jgi:hypothetical protein